MSELTLVRSVTGHMVPRPDENQLLLQRILRLKHKWWSEDGAVAPKWRFFYVSRGWGSWLEFGWVGLCEVRNDR